MAMKSMWASSLALAAAALAGCAQLGGEEGLAVPTFGAFEIFNPAGEGLEPIFGAEIKGDALVVRVASNGCTEKAHFEARPVTLSERVQGVDLVRLKPDQCKAFLPDGTVLSFSFEDLRLPASALVIVRNPLTRK